MDSSEAIILVVENRREADRLCTVYSREYGKFDLMARGVRKMEAKLKGGLEMLNHVRISSVVGRYYPIVTDVEIIDDFRDMRNDITKIEYALGCVHFFNRAVSGRVADDNAWEVLTGFLKFLDTARDTSSLTFDVFRLRLLSVLGFRPRLTHCIGCERLVEGIGFSFSPSAGGVMCDSCGKAARGEKLELSLSLVSFFPFLLGNDWTGITSHSSRPEAGELKIVTNAFAAYMLE